MKVAEINMVHFGSTGKIMLWIADCVRSNGEEARTYSPMPYLRHVKTGTVEIESHSYFGSRFENKLHRALYKFTGIIGIFSFFGTRRLIKMLDEYAPDIIHLHNLQNKVCCTFVSIPNQIWLRRHLLRCRFQACIHRVEQW